MWLVFRYALAAVRAVARERRELALENIALRHQIEVLTRNRRRPQLQPADRVLWSSLSRMWPSWRRHIVIVQPDTVVCWHRTVWRRYWRWKSRGGRRGRPRIEPELAELIRRMTQENPRWGHMRVLGELRKLGFRVSLLTVRRYRKDVPRYPLSSWRTFLENHRPEIWASDFFTVHTLWFQTLYVFFFVAHDRVLPLLVPPPPQGLVATGDTGGRARLEWTLVPKGLVATASTYKFQYRESSTDNGNGWTDVTGTAPTSPTYVRTLGCRTYDFRVSAQGDGTSCNTGWSDWSEATSTTVTTCTTGSRSTRDTGQSIGVPTVVEESQ